MNESSDSESDSGESNSSEEAIVKQKKKGSKGPQAPKKRILKAKGKVDDKQ